MNEVIEPLMLNEPIQELIAGRRSAMDYLDLRRAIPPVERRGRGAWSSSLSAADLQCLLQVIEAELIPQLIGNYSPARCSPEPRSPA